MSAYLDLIVDFIVRHVAHIDAAMARLRGEDCAPKSRPQFFGGRLDESLLAKRREHYSSLYETVMGYGERNEFFVVCVRLLLLNAQTLTLTFECAFLGALTSSGSGNPDTGAMIWQTFKEYLARVSEEIRGITSGRNSISRYTVYLEGQELLPGQPGGHLSSDGEEHVDLLSVLSFPCMDPKFSVNFVIQASPTDGCEQTYDDGV